MNQQIFVTEACALILLVAPFEVFFFLIWNLGLCSLYQQKQYSFRNWPNPMNFEPNSR